LETKSGQEDALAAQILERKTIDKIRTYVNYEDVPLVREETPLTMENAVSATEEPQSEGGSHESSEESPETPASTDA
jgi:hypothetical protein